MLDRLRSGVNVECVLTINHHSTSDFAKFHCKLPSSPQCQSMTLSRPTTGTLLRRQDASKILVEWYTLAAIYIQCCCTTMVQTTSLANWQIGSMLKAWFTCAVPPCIPRPEARSSVGTKLSRTAFCSKIITCQVTLNKRLLTSSATKIMKASAISRPLMFTSGVDKPTYLNVKGLNTRPSKYHACIIAALPHNINQQMTQSLLSIRLPFVSNYLTTDMVWRLCIDHPAIRHEHRGITLGKYVEPSVAWNF